MKGRFYGWVLGGLLVAVLATGAAPATAEMVSADFTAGSTTTEVDGYVGRPGDGWVTAWAEWKSGSATKTVTLRTPPGDGTELKEGLGRYLEAKGGQNTAGTGSFTVGRSYKTVDKTPIDWTKKFTIRFTVRIDEDVDATGAFTNVEERYQFFDRSNISGVSDTTSAFVISGASKDTSGTVFPAEVAGEWTFFNGLRTGSWDATRSVNTDVAVRTGHVYDFEVVVKPETQSYDAAVRDVTTEPNAAWVRKYNLGWRTSATAVGGYLVFAGRDGQTVSDSDLRMFSLDAVSIVPEPATLLLLIVAGTILAAMRRTTPARAE